MATKPTLRTTFPLSDAGRTAVYMLRWINAEGEAGPWSAPAPAPAPATVAA